VDYPNQHFRSYDDLARAMRASRHIAAVRKPRWRRWAHWALEGLGL
jgi:hypothetical protein